MMESLDSLLKSGASESEIYASIEEYKEKYADYGRDRRSAIEFHLRNVERLLMPTQTTNVLVKTLQMSNHVHDDEMSASIASNDASTTNDATSVDGPIAGDGEGNPSTHVQSKQQQQQQLLLLPPQEQASPAVDGTTQPPFSDMKSLFNHLVELLQVTPDQATALKDSRFVAQEMDECLKNSLNVLGELRNRLLQCGDSLESEFSTIRTILTPTQAAKFLVWVANNKACMHMLNELWDRVYLTDDNSNSKSATSNTATAAGDAATTTGSANTSPR